MEATPLVSLRVVNSVAIITLNKPKALGALSHEMVLALGAILGRCRHEEVSDASAQYFLSSPWADESHPLADIERKFS